MCKTYSHFGSVTGRKRRPLFSESPSSDLIIDVVGFVDIDNELLLILIFVHDGMDESKEGYDKDKKANEKEESKKKYPWNRLHLLL